MKFKFVLISPLFFLKHFFQQKYIIFFLEILLKYKYGRSCLLFVLKKKRKLHRNC